MTATGNGATGGSDEDGGPASRTEVPPGFGLLVLTFIYPDSAAANVIYEKTTPRLRVDGSLIESALSWGEHRFLLPTGTRKCEVWLPFEALGFGRVRRKIMIADGVETFVEYQAPKSPAAPGSLEYRTASS